jgi:two-component system OmpR family sensor kinase
MFRSRSIRVRLLVGVALLSCIGLAAADVVTYTSLRSFLLHRVDTSLEAAHVNVERIAQGGQRRDGDPAGGRGGRVGPPAQGVDWYQVRTLAGRRLAGGFLVGGGSPPDVGASIHIPARSTSSGVDRVAYFTVSADDGSHTYRVRASIEAQSPNQVLLVASSLGDVYGTLHRLELVELIVTLAVIAAVAVLGLWVVRVGLRPLRAIEATAATIAAGDLSQRVDLAEPKTEVGRLGASLNAMLAQIEAAFTARQLAEDQLRRFVADASHELRTPIAAVRAYAELFERGAASRPDDLARSMSGIARETHRMGLLVDDLLLLARLDEGRPLARDPVDLADVVHEAVDAARVLDADRTIATALEPTLITGDHDRLRQAVDNLLANVRAHTPRGTRVDVSLRHAAGFARLTVADNGPGFTDEQSTHLFERFYRIDASRTRASGGVGLGLSIVAAIVGSHGGRVEARPSTDGGATFVASFPLATLEG